jgi:mono/diheme cytochrome c family protein
MNYRFTTILLVAFAARALAAPVSFTNQIKPIFATRCEECHSGDEPDGGFDVTTFANLLKKGERAGHGIVAGKPDDSAIVQYVEGKRKPRMPKKKDPLTAAEIALIRDWIAGGAVDDTGKAPAKPLSGPTSKLSITVTWDAPVSFNPTDAAIVRRFLRLQLVQPAPAPPGAAVEGGNAVDQFIVAKWPKDGPTPILCDDTTFVRRVYLDLIGVIPRPTMRGSSRTTSHQTSARSSSMRCSRATPTTPRTGCRSGKTRYAATASTRVVSARTVTTGSGSSTVSAPTKRTT